MKPRAQLIAASVLIMLLAFVWLYGGHVLVAGAGLTPTRSEAIRLFTAGLLLASTAAILLFQIFHRRNPVEAEDTAVHSSAILGKNGRPTNPIQASPDSTTDEERFLNLDLSLQRLTALLDALPEGIVLMDEHYVPTLINDSGREHLSHLSPNRSEGTALEKIGGTPIAGMLQELSDQTTECAGPDGKRSFEVTSKRIAANGHGGGWMVILRDVTLERRLRAQSEQEHRLAAVGQLAAGIAHDFNNLLTVVIGSSQLLGMRSDVPDDIRTDLELIGKQGTRAAQLIRQVLDFSRKSDIERHPLDPRPFLKESVKLLRRTLPENIRIHESYDEEPCRLNTNLNQLQQVLTNLAVNARDAMPAGGDLTIRLTRVEYGIDELRPIPGLAPGVWSLLQVSDTGTGIPPEVLQHIYEPFFTTKESDRGTGLGLSQVHGIVHQHDGQIEIRSTPGQGTTFTLYFPHVNEPMPAAAPPLAPVQRGNGQTILLVEDDGAVRMAARAMLEHLGYRVEEALNGEDAMGLGPALQADLILTDLVMPQMGGQEMLQEMRASGCTAPVVIMTGYWSDEVEGQMKEEVAGWIRKPLSLVSVADTIARVLNEAEESGVPAAVRSQSPSA